MLLGPPLLLGVGAPCPNYFGPAGEEYVCVHQSGQDWNSFVAVLGNLGKALQSDPECFAPNAAANFFQLANYIVAPPGFAGAIGGSANQVGPVPITINSDRFTGNNTYTQYLTILHEIGHLLDPNGYNQADGVILPDGTSGGAANNQLIVDNCTKTLGD